MKREKFNAMADEHEYDVEKNGGVTGGVFHASSERSSQEKQRPSMGYEDGAVPGESFEVGNGLYAKVQRLAGRFNVEQRGIERVPEDERTDTGFKALLNVSTMVGVPGELSRQQ